MRSWCIYNLVYNNSKQNLRFNNKIRFDFLRNTNLKKTVVIEIEYLSDAIKNAFACYSHKY